jgi:putative ABC transport system permease protein
MTLAGLSLAYLKDRALNTALNVLLLALGVATMVILVLFSSQLEGRFARDAQGIDLVVGAKGSPLQLILSSIYHVDVPTGNVPLETIETLRRRPGVGKVIPLALGDSFRSFRIVGTEPAYALHYGATVSEGRMFAGPMQATIGSEVARRTGATLGQRFVGSHGLAGDGGHEHEERPFTVVGILAPTGTVLDRLILTPVESVWDVHGIEHDEGEHHDEAAHADEGHNQAGHDHEGHAHDEHEAEAAAPREAGLEPEVTAALVSYRSSLAAVQLPNFINKQTNLQAAVPAVEITRLLSLVGIGLDAVRAFAVLLMLTAGLSIFVALYTALRQREADMAMLRVIGAKPAGIFGQILLEGLLLAGAGALLGLALGHGVVALAAATFDQLRDMGLNAWTFLPAEAVIVAAALGIGALAALIPALRVFRVDVADTLAHAR